MDRTTTQVLQNGFMADMSRLLEWKDFARCGRCQLLRSWKLLPLNTYIQTISLGWKIIDRTAMTTYEGTAPSALTAEQMEVLHTHGYGFGMSIAGDRWLIYNKRPIRGGSMAPRLQGGVAALVLQHGSAGRS
ncbi:MAG: hypothetical protein U0232_19670 [Thermomicrobiales bacterium]